MQSMQIAIFKKIIIMSHEKQNTSVAKSIGKEDSFKHTVHVTVITGHYISVYMMGTYIRMLQRSRSSQTSVDKFFNGFNVAACTCTSHSADNGFRNASRRSIWVKVLSISPYSSCFDILICISFLKTLFKYVLDDVWTVKSIGCSRSLQLGGTCMYTMQIPCTVNL